MTRSERIELLIRYRYQSGCPMSNDLYSLPCVLMRGGTSKGPFFLASDLPGDPAQRDRLLLDLMGAGHPLQIDGIGGGNALSSKVAIIGPASRADADIDYLFAQVRPDQKVVDTTPNCGNMLAAVGPFAIESGMVAASDPQTLVRIHNVNTGKVVLATVQTPRGRVSYRGDTAIAGAPGTAAPISLAFLDAAGARTGKLLPTGAASEWIDGVEVSCVDCAMPMVMLAASALGVTGEESVAALNADTAMLARLERIRVEAGRRMGIADAADRVIPKPVLLLPPRAGGTLQVRYFMPHQCHSALAITGAVGISTACVTPGTLAQRMAGDLALPADVALEHPSGRLEVALHRPGPDAAIVASVVRTARRLFEGRVFASTDPRKDVAAAWSSAA
ncbi:4-oxalomesaconate tautomerase [Luteimonas sp. S4-F44]|uniref:4-oxalomesaconate tautomerase n=1 Tax=Luteimonas sp. S4-F44 TaxID=2925842 RepID=UPI001F53D212|nr:4-oxalomesaconate tautomerase [Luteimonas sp. S4-F44]UNK43919.1 4-oxalomesaconate tautomerase [Luteimonas sp. S4-F44]